MAERGGRSNPSGPDFLGIGAQKAGTSWLHVVLDAHPEIWVPPAKELHYFDRLDGWPDTLASKARDPIFRLELSEQLRERDLRATVRTLPWLRRLYFGARDDSWYRRLFADGEGLVSGEITPGYSTLAADQVAHVHRVAPDARVIFILRNPVQRAWSHACMDLTRLERLDSRTVIDAEFIRHFEGSISRLRTDYLRTIDSWREHYAADRFFIGFMEDIRDRPEAFAGDLYRFLGVDPDRGASSELLRRDVNAGADHPIRESLEGYLRQRYTPMMESLLDRFEGREHDYVAAWLDRGA